METTRTLKIVIDPSGAQTGGRVVSRSIDDIAKSATSAKSVMKDLTDAQTQAAKSAQGSFQALVQQQDALRAKFNPTFAVIQRYKQTQEEIRSAHRLGALSVNEMATALGRERQAALASIEAIKGYSTALNSAATARRTLRGGIAGSPVHGGGADQFGTANLAAQFQDIAVTSAMGMSPLQIALQQGTQISAVLGPMGAAGAVRGLGAAFLSIINPVSLVTLGLVAGTAALIQYFSSVREGTANVDALLAQHAENIRALKGAYGQAATGLAEYTAASGSTLAANTQETLKGTLDVVVNAARNEIAEALNLPASAFDGNINIINQFKAAVLELDKATKANKPGLLQYIEALSKIAVSNEATESQKALANSLRAVDAEAEKAARTLPAMLKAAKVAADESAGSLDRLKAIDLSEATQGVTSLGSALQSASQTAQQSANAQGKALMALQQSSGRLRTMKTELSEIQKALADAANTPVAEVFGDNFMGKGASDAIANAATSIQKVMTALGSGGMTATQAHAALELVRQSLKGVGGDARSVDQYINAMIAGYLRTMDLKMGVDSLSQSILSIPDRVVNIGVRQYTVGATGGGTANVNVIGGSTGTQEYGGLPMMSQQQYDVGGGKMVTVTGMNGVFPTAQLWANLSAESRERIYNRTGGTDWVRELYGSRASGGPVSGGGTYLVGEKGAELVTMSGSGHVTNATSTASILSGGRDTLSLMEDHLYSILAELRLQTPYMATMESDTQTIIGCLNAVKSSIGSLSVASRSGGSSSSGSRGGGYSGGGASGNFNRGSLNGSGAFDYANLMQVSKNPYAVAIETSIIGDYRTFLQQQQARLNGFATGGQIMPGEDQKVEFFKRNSERVIIVDDSRVSDGRGGAGVKEKTTVHAPMTFHFHGDFPVSSTGQGLTRVCGAVRDQRPSRFTPRAAVF